MRVFLGGGPSAGSAAWLPLPVGGVEPVRFAVDHDAVLRDDLLAEPVELLGVEPYEPRFRLLSDQHGPDPTTRQPVSGPDVTCLTKLAVTWRGMRQLVAHASRMSPRPTLPRSSAQE